jgi:hypothetical protein
MRVLRRMSVSFAAGVCVQMGGSAVAVRRWHVAIHSVVQFNKRAAASVGWSGAEE